MKDQKRLDSLKDLKNHENFYDDVDDSIATEFILGAMCLGMIIFGMIILIHDHLPREFGLKNGTYSIPMLKGE